MCVPMRINIIRGMFFSMQKKRIRFFSVLTAAFVWLSAIAVPVSWAADNSDADKNGKADCACAQSVTMNVPPDMQQGSDNVAYVNSSAPSVRWQKADFIHSFCPNNSNYNETVDVFADGVSDTLRTDAAYLKVVMLC